ncbi:hypothetical protein CEXT_282271 [Caerostris extrusa]|uniref:Uncharacterized protein n=1 Tax=Caerostris extrusa TaxID=172846 RepID=A0AAV4W826_CAEEX|nr:hypothetical protein CEXT_282271 [Caerostris extrusa]
MFPLRNDNNNSPSEDAFLLPTQQTFQKILDMVYENESETLVDYHQRLIHGQQRFLKDTRRYSEHEQIEIELLL